MFLQTKLLLFLILLFLYWFLILHMCIMMNGMRLSIGVRIFLMKSIFPISIIKIIMLIFIFAVISQHWFKFPKTINSYYSMYVIFLSFAAIRLWIYFDRGVFVSSVIYEMWYLWCFLSFGQVLLWVSCYYASLDKYI